MILNKKNITIYSLFTLLYLLLFLGRHFSKAVLIGPVFLHDFILLLVFLFSLSTLNRKLSQPNVLLLILISVGYLLIAFLIGRQPIFILRHYMLVVYLALVYFITENVKGSFTTIIRLLKRLALVGVAVQVVFLLLIRFHIVVPDKSVLYEYYSPVVIMLFPVLAAYILSGKKSIFEKFVIYAFILGVSAALGHSSIVLSILFVGAIYIIYIIGLRQTLLYLSIFIVGLLIVSQLSKEYNDNNANWRIDYWKIGMNNGTHNFGLGNGFGKAYLTLEEASMMTTKFGDSAHFDRKGERYVKAFHNSFVTFFSYMGFITLLLLPVYYKAAKGIFEKGLTPDQLFMILSLFGVSVWSALNVILELPHSSVLFWVIYFTTYHSFMTNNSYKKSES